MKPIPASALLVALPSFVAVSVGWSQPAHDRTKPVDPEVQEPSLSQWCLEVKKQADAAAAKQKDEDDRLRSLVASMNEAPAAEKAGAMAAVLNELIVQRGAERERRLRLDAAMREHIMQHLADAAPPEMALKLKTGLDPCATTGPTASPSP